MPTGYVYRTAAIPFYILKEHLRDERASSHMTTIMTFDPKGNITDFFFFFDIFSLQ